MKGVAMVGLLTLTGSALAVGYGLFRYFSHEVHTLQTEAVASDSVVADSSAKQKNIQQSLPTNVNRLSAVEQSDLIPRTEEMRATLQRGFNTSSISLGLASGSLLIPAMQFTAVPVLIYMGVPSAQQAFERLRAEGRPSRALVETAVLAICLGGGWYLLGSLGFWCYYTGRIAYHRRDMITYYNAWTQPQTARRVEDAEEITVSVETLQTGDKIFVETSDVVPVDSLIIEGVALVQPTGSNDDTHHCLKRVGDRVMASDIIIAGRLSLHVL